MNRAISTEIITRAESVRRFCAGRREEEGRQHRSRRGGEGCFALFPRQQRRVSIFPRPTPFYRFRRRNDRFSAGRVDVVDYVTAVPYKRARA